MMTPKILLLSLIGFVTLLPAQTFKKYPYESPFEGIIQGAVVFADIDGDDDDDVLITGADNASKPTTKLYRNEGMNRFTEMPGGSFYPVKFSSAAFADVDGDQDQDLLVMGEIQYDTNISTLYLNDGLGNFTEKPGTIFVGAKVGSINFSDIDGDNDPDVLATGYNYNPDNGLITIYARLYTNDGSGNFTEMTPSSLESIYYSAVSFADVDGDLDQDVLMTGQDSQGAYTAKLYCNDGAGHFTPKVNVPFIGNFRGSVTFFDADGDQDQDVIITGQKENNACVAKLYLNDGLGNYDEVVPSAFAATCNNSTVDVADIDGDNDPDVIIAGSTLGSPSTRLYRNIGAGNFTLVSGTPFFNFSQGVCRFSDTDGDNDMDVLLSGYDNFGNTFSRLYVNNGVGQFEEAYPVVYKGAYQGDVAFADIDGDGDQDLVYQGSNYLYQSFIQLMTNDGAGKFSEVASIPFLGTYWGDLAFSDVDADNDQDLLVTGGTGGLSSIAKLYLNDGAGHFTEKNGTPFVGVHRGGSAFFDMDGDHDDDLVITGQDNNANNVTNLYRNDGAGNFTESFPNSLGGVVAGAVAIADVNGDQYPDVVIAGEYGGERHSRLYINDGTGLFTEQTDVPFEGVFGGSVTFSDVDGDNDKDLLITGEINTFGDRIAKLYLNDGTGHFTEDLDVPFEGVDLSAAVFTDLNGDNDEDLVIAGRTSTGKRTAKWFSNDGAGHFTEMLNHPFTGIIQCSIATADVDGDHDKDIVMVGVKDNDHPITQVYINEGGNTGLEEHAFIKQSTVLLYPNPSAKGQFNIEYESISGKKAQVSVIALNGTVLFQKDFSLKSGLNKLTMGFSHLPVGMHLMRIEENGRIQYVKLVVQ